MRISSLKVFTIGTPWRNYIFVKLYTDEGLTGVGEATLGVADETMIAYLEGAARRHIIGSDPFNIEDLCLRMFRDDFWRGGIFSNSGISAVEIACWDIVGKACGQPIYKLLGGACRDRIKAYANGWYKVERKPEEFARAVEQVLAKGYRALKLDPFGAGTYELDRKEKLLSISLVEAVRAAAGEDVEIMIEGHGRFSPVTAIELARELEPFKPTWFEEPVPPDNIQALSKVAGKINIPIAAGERSLTRYGFRELLETGAVDIIQPDLIHAGGILEVKKIAAMADSYYVTVAPHNSQGPICTAASVHLDACITNFKIQECFDDFEQPYLREAVPGAFRVEDGYFKLPERSGLGVDINEEVIAEHPPKAMHFNLFRSGWEKRESTLLE